ncbi:hypothetical protein B0T26DRAFT_764726 [Lasiosphaeria miniovina]|uniref:Uncharacterized protein n=1 Tax=Lasiosphaeria miniovina TaxID=1954250 RepID=A0AA40B428_9PEZI|nr:uncharacterized protein B0T26DRAFT_764726 [Lasiosphaeria miniovina]KAK0727142.1 hypothetical protein B0T26DRAFT_764726 [Lasiosphaeria miniovina]
MEPQSFDLLQWEELCAIPRAPGFIAMNWTEVKLHRSTRGRLRKANPARQRQREYFANARARAAEVKNSSAQGVGAPGPVGTQPEYDDQALERMRQKPLAKKDWGVSRRSILGPAKNRPNQVSDNRASGNKTSGEAVQDVQKRRATLHESELEARKGDLKRLREAIQPTNRMQDNPDFDAVFRERLPLSSLPLSSSQIAGENPRREERLISGRMEPPINSVEAVEGSQESVECLRVSPGVSEISREVRERSQSQPRLTDAALNRFTDPKPSGLEGLGQAFGSISSSLILSRFEDLMSRIHRRHEQTRTQKEAPPLDSQMHVPDDDPAPHQQDGNMQTNVSRQTPPTAAEQIAAPSCKSDPDQAWKSFLFGGESTDGVEEAAFDEAKRDVARDLQPSTYSSCIGDKPLSDWDSNIAAAGTVHTNGDESSGFANDVLSSAGASASRKATLRPSSTGVMSDPTSAGQDVATRNHSDDRTGGSMSDTLAHPAMSTTSLAVEPARSKVGVNDRFVPPKLSVGSRSSLKRLNEAPMPVSTVGNRRARRKIRARDGQANIRALPSYNSDPIEDIKDVGETRPSLFGSLDLA